MRVLLIEQEPALGKFIGDELREQKFAVDWMSDCRLALALLEINRYTAVVVEVGPSREQRQTAVAGLRKQDRQLPIVIIGSQSDPAEKVNALDDGADDYLARPINPHELGARLRALMRRAERRLNEPLILGSVTLNPTRCSATRDGKEARLTKSEYRLLCALMAQPGQLVPRARLDYELYGLAENVSSNSVEVHIHNLRRKLGEDFINNVRGRGYRVRAAEHEPFSIARF
jgi:DNA-binding response OmpR family regulator